LEKKILAGGIGINPSLPNVAWTVEIGLLIEWLDDFGL
jgi:hypothetical protein